MSLPIGLIKITFHHLPEKIRTRIDKVDAEKNGGNRLNISDKLASRFRQLNKLFTEKITNEN